MSVEETAVTFGSDGFLQDLMLPVKVYHNDDGGFNGGTGGWEPPTIIEFDPPDMRFSMIGVDLSITLHATCDKF